MFRNNFRIALRSLWKNKVSTLINIVGLTTGLASCLLIVLFIQHELSFDAFQPNGDRIARVIMEYSFDGGTESAKGDFTSTKVAPVMSRTFPEVQKALRLSGAEVIVKQGDVLLTETNFLFVDSTFFDIFSYEIIEGNPKTALNGPFRLVLTETTAQRYFGREPAIGKTLLIGNKATPYEVTGVIKDYPANSQFTFDLLGSFSSLGANQETTYFEANYTTYLLLQNQHSIETLQRKLHPFMEKEMKGSGAKVHFYLEEFDKIHLNSPYSANVPNTSITYLYVLIAVAGLILMIVCFTYINLSTAKSIERAKEVGVRKVSGAAKGQLFWQFIGESFIVCGLSVLVSILLTVLILPWFGQMIEKSLTIAGLFKPAFITFVIGGTIIISLLAGSYPSLILSRLQPASVLKGVFRNSTSAKWIQQSLIVFQFAISVLLIISTIVIQRQLHFIQNKNLGYDRDRVIELRIDYETSYDQAQLLKQQLQSGPGVLYVSRTSSSPVNIRSGYSMWSAQMDEGEQISVNANPIDEDYLRLNGLKLIAGTTINEQDMREAGVEDWQKRQYHFILNESAARRLGWTPEQAIGQKMQTQRPGVVKGVIKDFNFQSVHEMIKPLVLFTAPRGGRLLVKIAGSNTTETLSFMKNKWKELLPNRPFEYHFIDEDFARLYDSELQLGKAMNLFASIAIILATLGLFGLSSYIVQQRTKEIGIRKVMGASLGNLLHVVSRKFVILVLVSIITASPIAWWLMTQWLNGFSYKTELSWWIFLATGLMTISVAVLTVCIHAWRVSRTNPVVSLRTE